MEIDEGEPERYTKIVVHGLPDDVPPNLAGVKEGMVRDRETIEDRTGYVLSIMKKLLKGLPGETTYFSQIEIHNGLLYVYVSDMERRNSQQIDIFSLDGKYLYRSFIRVPEALLISINPFIIKDYIDRRFMKKFQ